MFDLWTNWQKKIDECTFATLVLILLLRNFPLIDLFLEPLYVLAIERLQNTFQVFVCICVLSRSADYNRL